MIDERNQELTEKFVISNIYVYLMVKVIVMNLEIGIRQSAAKFLNFNKIKFLLGMEKVQRLDGSGFTFNMLA